MVSNEYKSKLMGLMEERKALIQTLSNQNKIITALEYTVEMLKNDLQDREDVLLVVVSIIMELNRYNDPNRDILLKKLTDVVNLSINHLLGSELPNKYTYHIEDGAKIIHDIVNQTQNNNVEYPYDDENIY